MPRIPPAANRAYAIEMERRLAEMAAVEASAGQRVSAVLRDLKEAILQRLPDPSKFTTGHLRQIDAIVDEEVKRVASTFGDVMDSAVSDAARIGNEAATQPVAKALVDSGALPTAQSSILRVGLPPDLVASFQAVTADLVQDVSTQAKTAITNQVRRAAAGVISPLEAQKEIAAELRVSRTAGSRVGVAARSETIIRTELNRVYSVANDLGLKKVKELVPDLRSQWITTIDGRQRSAHQELHLKTVPVGGTFRNSLGRIRYPLDPQASKANTIKCRCTLIAFRINWDKPLNVDSSALVTV